MISYLLTGLAAGIAHVFSGPDHIAAVAPLSIDHGRRSWLIGLLWGFGHTLGMACIGLIFIVLQDTVRFDLISRYSDQLIGSILIGIGVWGFIHRMYPHTHTSYIQAARTLFAALIVGVFHGVAGFSHLLAVLPSLVLPSRTASVAYLSAFGAGTLLSMISFTWMIGTVSQKLTQANKDRFLKGFSTAACTFAIVIGIVWMIRPLIF